MNKERRTTDATVKNRYTSQGEQGQAIDGDNEKRLNELIENYEYIIKIYIKKYHLTKEYEDVMQEGRIAIYKALQSFKEKQGANLLTYISVCVKRRLLSYIRNKQTKKAMAFRNQISYETIEGISGTDSRFSVEEHVLTKIHVEKSYNKAKMNIKPLELEIYNKYIYGYSFKELSDLYQIPRKKLYVIVARARKKIRQAMKTTKY